MTTIKKTKNNARVGQPIKVVDKQNISKASLTKLEKQARRESAQSIRMAANGSFGGAYGGAGNSGSGAITSADSNFYSPQLSTDFLELPQSEREKRELFRFWYTCVEPGTEITMGDFSVKAIEDIKVNDRVFNGFGKLTSVIEVFKHDIDDALWHVKVRGRNKTVNVTGNHPFLVVHACDGAKKPEFIYSKDLVVGDYICSPKFDGIYSSENDYQFETINHFLHEIESIDEVPYKGPVFNFEVKGEGDEKSYIANGLATHNTHPIVGAAIDFHCFPPGAPVTLTDGSVSPIESLNVGDEVLNGFGEPTKVLQVFQHNVCGPMTRLKVRGVQEKIDCTENHPFLVYRAAQINNKRIDGIGEPQFVFACDLMVGDYTCSPCVVNLGYSEEHSDCIKIRNNVLRIIEKVETVQYNGTVHNIEVDGEGDRKSYIAYGLATHNTDVPMSKIHLSLPKGSDVKKNKQILHFYEQMSKRLRLFQVLYDATHEYWLHGAAYLFAEDHDMTEEIPEELISDIKQEEVGEIDYAGRTIKKTNIVKNDKSTEEAFVNIKKYVQDHYQGWQRIQILPPEQIKLEVFQYTNRTTMQLIPSEKDRLVVLRAQQQDDPEASKIADDIPDQIKENLLSGQPIPLNTSPYDDFLCSSFCFHLAHKKSAYDDRGISVLERCHVPGTEVTARRDGQIRQVPIEQLNPETDEVLGGLGNWKKFEVGSRPYSGEIVGLSTEKIKRKIWMTPDHKMQVLRNGELVDLEAQEIYPGDFIKIVQEERKNLIDSIDLYEFFKDQKWTHVCRTSGEEFPVNVIPEKSGDSIILHHSFLDKNPQRVSRRETLDKVIDWIANIDGQVEVQSSTFIEKFGISGNSVYRAIIRDLEELGYAAPCVKSDSKFKSVARVFKQAKLDSLRLYECNESQVCPETLTLDGDLGYFVGYYLGDGWTNHTKQSATKYGPSGICWEQESENSSKSVETIVRIIEKLGLNVQEYPDYALGWVHIHTDWFSRWLGRNFGHNKKDKHLPAWINNANDEFILGIIRGMVDSDGWKTRGKINSVTASISTTTKDLMEQMFLMATSIGMTPSLKFCKRDKPIKQANGTYCNNPKPMHTLNFGVRNDVIKIIESGFCAKIDVDEVNEHEYGTSGMCHYVHDGKTYYRIKGASRDQYSGPVYSLNVHDDHTFFAEGVNNINCLRTLTYSDKLRQAQTSIASRAMTPKRVVWADKMSEIDVGDLRDQVDQALIDPDFTIVTNFEVHWDEIGARDRLLDLASEYEITNRLLYIGLRITESMLTGESSFSGERIHLDVMNTMYLLYRETIVAYVEENLFAPVAEKKGFYEIDESGNKILLYPKLKFTRLALRDNSELQDFMFNLYQKGSLPISYIYELINVDPHDASAELRRDLFTPRDSTYNELVRTLLTDVGTKLAENSDITKKIADDLGLELKEEDSDRFGSK
jgi:intein/homing endonuclease